LDRLPRSRTLITGLLVAGLTAISACTGSAGNAASTSASASSTNSGGRTSVSTKVTLRLGYFPNITHATALVGIRQGIFASSLGPDVTLKPEVFNAGPAAVEALFGDAVDASYLGPNSAINGFYRSKGKALRIISGATSGGAFLVVKPAVNAAAQLKGTKLASPQLGGTQDVALRSWLKTNGLSSDTTGGGDVSIVPQANAQTLDAFKNGAISGAWVPEPWATRLVQEGGGHILVDERTLWPGGRFVTTELVVATKFLDAHPDVVQGLLEGQFAANDFVNAHPIDAQQIANAQIKAITGKSLGKSVVAAAWQNLTFTNDPMTSSLGQNAAAATAVGLLDQVDLTGIYALGPLHAMLSNHQSALTGL
jgi:NitT/TauT family transport system substrate-binding protein